jgi:DNA-directed RNA polymerase specialized sigma24 family protein
MTNDEKYFIISNNTKIIHSVLRRYHIDQRWHEDLYQECVLSVLIALDRYDKSKCKESTYVYIISEFRVKSWIREQVQKGEITQYLQEENDDWGMIELEDIINRILRDETDKAKMVYRTWMEYSGEISMRELGRMTNVST